jgi:hypothetical protein
MTEILTESFCERCGTRYDFGAPEPLSKKRKTRGLVSGLRQFIMSQDSLSDSIGDAMRAEEDALASAQIDAFQDAFNFCLDCRRYTCVSCWNDDAGRCRSCMPLAGVDDIAGFDERLLQAPQTSALGDAVSAAESDVLTWPTAERVAPGAWPSVDSIAPAAETYGAPSEAEPTAAEATEVELEPAPEAAPEPEPIAADVEVEPEPPVIPEAPVAPPAPPPAPPPVPRAATPRRDLRETILRGPVTRPAPAPRTAQPESLAARRSQLDRLGLDDPGEGAVPIGRRDQLPYRSSGAGASAVGGSPALSAVWDASTRYLQAGAQQALLRPCGSCGLTVSSTARFCRRCGAPQTLSA